MQGSLLIAAASGAELAQMVLRCCCDYNLWGSPLDPQGCTEDRCCCSSCEAQTRQSATNWHEVVLCGMHCANTEYHRSARKHCSTAEEEGSSSSGSVSMVDQTVCWSAMLRDKCEPFSRC